MTAEQFFNTLAVVVLLVAAVFTAAWWVWLEGARNARADDSRTPNDDDEEGWS